MTLEEGFKYRLGTLPPSPLLLSMNEVTVSICSVWFMYMCVCISVFIGAFKAIFKINFYWGIVALQYCVSFYCRAKWISYNYTHAQAFRGVWLFVTLRTVAHQAPLSMRVFRWEYWSGCHFLFQGNFLTQSSNPRLLCLLGCRWILYHWDIGEAHIYIYPLFSGFPPHLGHAEHWVEFTLLHSRFSSVTYLHTVSIVYMSVSISQFLPLNPFSPLGAHTFALYVSVSISALQIKSFKITEIVSFEQVSVLWWLMKFIFKNPHIFHLKKLCLTSWQTHEIAAFPNTVMLCTTELVFPFVPERCYLLIIGVLDKETSSLVITNL